MVIHEEEKELDLTLPKTTKEKTKEEERTLKGANNKVMEKIDCFWDVEERMRTYFPQYDVHDEYSKRYEEDSISYKFDRKYHLIAKIKTNKSKYDINNYAYRGYLEFMSQGIQYDNEDIRDNEQYFPKLTQKNYKNHLTVRL